MLQCGFYRKETGGKRRWGQERMRGEGTRIGRGIAGRNGEEDEVERYEGEGMKVREEEESLGGDVERKEE